MRFGWLTLSLSPSPDEDAARIDQQIAQVCLAEQLGFDDVWLTEHYFTGESVYNDALLFAAAVAMRTERIRIGFAVVQLPFHHPVQLAVRLALLDNLSKGRIDVGKKAGDGSLPIQYKVVEARAVLNHAGQIKEMPGVAAAAGQPPSAGQVSADGRQVTIESGAGNATLPHALHDQVAQALPTLPAEALTPGKKFDVIVPMTLFGGMAHGAEKANARWTYTLRSLAPDEALFDVQESLPENASMSVSSGPVVHLSGGGKGVATFSLKEGIFTSMTLDTNIQMTVVVSIPAGLAGGGATGGAAGGGDAGSPSSIEIKSSIQGPISMSLAPAAGR